MRVLRVFAVLVTVVATVMVLSVGTAAAKKPTNVFRFDFKGRGADATLTDCPSPPVETTCHATLVNTSTNSESDLSVLLLVVHLHPDGTFEFDVADSGFTNAANVRVDKKLASAHVDALVPLDSGGTLAVSVDWTASGPETPQQSNSHFRSECFSITEHFKGSTRPATATGTVGGIAQVSTTVPEAPVTDLFSSKDKFIERDFLC